ncbi:MAG: signal peptidase II [Gemmatimonadetes bacterium]|jgi:signal peptidase II|nr:signal peptidase II [Gemmatimonadota bacterium]MBT5056579.1 signal peptidase II [Gemmatimonadota bacterium]MBT5145239.1 signal peptidase II [Gemmatimonadota bacterium]MBT5589620.1 signal peptidase II [Gemmatimonadota bacterium]MBT5965323.1 signal peptidase II [Gemmatimonadota bacterium]
MRFWIDLIWVPLALVLDQVTKYIVVQSLPPYEPQSVMGDVIRLTYIHNRGAAFGLDLGGPVVHTVIATAALGLLGWMLATLPVGARLQRAALAMVLGGAIGNIIDRIRIHQVIDFVDVGFGDWRWPVFNVADSFVTVGVLLLAITYSRVSESDADEESSAQGSLTPESSPASGTDD